MQVIFWIIKQKTVSLSYLQNSLIKDLLTGFSLWIRITQKIKIKLLFLRSHIMPQHVGLPFCLPVDWTHASLRFSHSLSQFVHTVIQMHLPWAL